MEQNGVLFLDYNGRNTAEIYGVSHERIARISDMLSTAMVEMLEEIDEYSWRDGQKNGFHKGKILKRFLEDIYDFQERIVVISLLDGLLKKMHDEYAAAFKKFR